MSKKPLPPPPGFRREKKVFGTSKRYVYPFADSDAGKRARQLHGEFMVEEEKRWEHSKLRRVAIRLGTQTIQSRQHTPQAVRNDEAIGLGMTIASTYHPLFQRRYVLHQVWEHMRHQPRYFMKIDIADAFGCVHPGFHENFPRPTVEVTQNLFDWADHGSSEDWDGWPFFHRGTGGLIQGAPSSSLLFEKACALSGLDQLLRETAKSHNATVTRYVDDIVFSRKPWDDRPFANRMYKTLKKKIMSCGFVVNEHKSRRVDTRFQPIEFLGVRVLRNRAKVRPAFFDRLGAQGFLKQGHLDWLDQIDQHRDLLWLERNT